MNTNSALQVLARIMIIARKRNGCIAFALNKVSAREQLAAAAAVGNFIRLRRAIVCRSFAGQINVAPLPHCLLCAFVCCVNHIALALVSLLLLVAVVVTVARNQVVTLCRLAPLER